MEPATCDTRFEELQPALSKPTLAVLDEWGFHCTTPVQAATIPLFMSNKDVAVEAVTGSGKTLAFVLPLVEMLKRLEDQLQRYQVGAIVISPTRELAQQIFGVAQPFIATVPGLRATLLVGGTEVALDVAGIKEHGAHVLIGTPGRLEDVLQRSACLDLRRLEVLVLDEADRLLDMGFQVQLTSILQRLPKQRRTGLFSATQTQAVEELARAGLRNPVRVEVRTTAPTVSKNTSRLPSGLCLSYMRCEAEAKPAQLVSFLAKHAGQQKCLVYLLTCACVDYWATVLPRLPVLKDLSIQALHGKMKQSVREKTLAEFTSRSAGALFCTDVAARGLDIPGVDWILQFDPPQDPNAFVHRVGRTARMGREGNALLFLLPKEDTYVDFLRLRKIPIAEVSPAEGTAPITDALRSAALADREVVEKGVRAFVSFVRGYREHQCRYIFRMKDLPLGHLGQAFGLLQLPSMPELRGKGRAMAAGFKPPKNVTVEAIAFRDKVREKQRQQRLKVAQAKGNVREVAGGKRERESVQSGKRGQEQRKAAVAADSESEEDDLEEDYRMLKKLKKGTISEGQFAKSVAGELASDEEEGGSSDEDPDATTTQVPRQTPSEELSSPAALKQDREIVGKKKGKLGARPHSKGHKDKQGKLGGQRHDRRPKGERFRIAKHGKRVA